MAFQRAAKVTIAYLSSVLGACALAVSLGSLLGATSQAAVPTTQKQSNERQTPTPKPVEASPSPTKSTRPAPTSATPAPEDDADNLDDGTDGQGSSADRADSGINNPWLVALLGGAAATLLLDRVAAWWADRQALKSLLKYLRREVAVVQREATARTDNRADAFAFRTDLPTWAWTTALESRVAVNLIKDEDLFDPINEFYGAVAEANHKAGIAAQILHFAIMATDGESHDNYMARARELTSDPYAEVQTRAKAAVEALDRKKVAR